MDRVHQREASTRAEQVDVLVVGLGIMGAMALWQLARRGLSVIGVEQFEPGHARGSSHGGSRIFRRIGTEGPAYVPLVRRADELWDELATASGEQLRMRTGGLTIGTVGGDYLAGALAAAREGDVEIQELDAAELRRRFPQHAVRDDDAAVYEPGAGVVFPERAVLAALASARAAGARVIPEATVIAVEPVGAGVRVRGASGRWHARQVVVAGGAWTGDLLPVLHAHVRVQRSVPSWIRADATYGPDAFPVFRRRSHELSGWGVPDVDGQGVKIGVSAAPKPWLRRPQDNWFAAGPDDLALVDRFVDEAFPELRGREVAAFPCMNARTADGQYLIGPVPGMPGVIVLGGFGGNGFKHAPAVGEVAADLVQGRRPRVPIDAFGPRRSAGTSWGSSRRPVFVPTGRPVFDSPSR